MTEIQRHLDYVSDQTQKITEALYRVTDLFKDTEPLKWTIRKEAVDILGSILQIQSFPPSELGKEVDILCDRIRRTIRILELAASNSFMSEINFNVLKREYVIVMDYLASRKPDLLPPPINLSDSSRHPLSISPLTRAPGKRHTIMAENAREHMAKDGVPRAKSAGVEERRERILSFIRGRDWTSVGDLMSIFQGRASGKTIQRDLIGMANEGLLLKEGDKRWRRYKAVSN